MYNTIPYIIPNTLGNTNSLLGIGSLFKKINWGSLLSNTQKTLNVMNQAIPLYYQVKPIFKNFKTLSKITKEINKSNSDTINNTINNNSNSNNYSNIKNTYPNPTFFI
ncbi:MAG: hypothetical protein IJ094_11165 [Bacilli bacterium]|nr:hypothetical protein [Bacilli bacterium]